MQTSNHEPVTAQRNAKSLPTITAFICANCSRAGRVPSSTNRPAPSPPDFCWPLPVRELLVPCTGRLQPEHILKAFEVGRRCRVRHRLPGGQLPHTRGQQALRPPHRLRARACSIKLASAKTGSGTISLPGSAREDMALGIAGEPDLAARDRRETSQLGCLEPELRALRKELADRIADLRPSPLHNSQFASAIDYSVDEDDHSEV